jgi:hypothetical protein
MKDIINRKIERNFKFRNLNSKWGRYGYGYGYDGNGGGGGYYSVCGNGYLYGYGYGEDGYLKRPGDGWGNGYVEQND